MGKKGKNIKICFNQTVPVKAGTAWFFLNTKGETIVRQFVISTMAPALWLLAIFDLMSIIAMFANHEQNHKNPVSFLTGILCLGLFYDSLILSLGAILPFGQLLKILSQFRYILHCVLIPLLFPICAYSLKIDKQKMRIICTGRKSNSM